MRWMQRSGGYAAIVATGGLLLLGCARTPVLTSPAAAPAPAGIVASTQAPVQVAQAGRGDAARPERSARAQFVDRSGNRVGDAHLQETPHGVLIAVNLENVPAGVRGFHIHDSGRCRPTFEAAGDHFNPTDRDHGLLNPRGPHAGDLPNIHVPDTGRLSFEVLARDVTLETGQRHSLLDGDGTALVIHERADDHRSHPSGEAGGRIACAVVEG